MSKALDGDSIGGLLIDVFHTDMIAARSTCGPKRKGRYDRVQY